VPGTKFILIGIKNIQYSINNFVTTSEHIRAITHEDEYKGRKTMIEGETCQHFKKHLKVVLESARHICTPSILHAIEKAFKF
jgi:hypothetical protein